MGEQRRTGKSRRGLFDWIGYGAKFLFGTAVEADTAGLRKEFDVIKQVAGTMLQDAERTRQGLSSYTKLTGERLDAMHSIIAQQQTEMDTVLGNLREHLM